MPKEIFPSSFECDCGHQSAFSERTVRDLKAMSQKKKVYLADSAPEEHTIVLKIEWHGFHDVALETFASNQARY